MMFASFWLFSFLGIYLDNVLPGVNGIRKPFYYLFQPSYWCGIKKKPRVAQVFSPARFRESEVGDDEQSFMFETKYIQRENYESASNDLKRQEADNKILKI